MALLPNLDKVHNGFNVSILKNYILDESHIIPNYRELNIQLDVTFEEKPIRIPYKQDKVLRRKTVPPVKMLWSNNG